MEKVNYVIAFKNNIVFDVFLYKSTEINEEEAIRDCYKQYCLEKYEILKLNNPHLKSEDFKFEDFDFKDYKINGKVNLQNLYTHFLYL